MYFANLVGMRPPSAADSIILAANFSHSNSCILKHSLWKVRLSIHRSTRVKRVGPRVGSLSKKGLSSERGLFSKRDLSSKRGLKYNNITITFQCRLLSYPNPTPPQNFPLTVAYTIRLVKPHCSFGTSTHTQALPPRPR